jgi:hypothetical protein
MKKVSLSLLAAVLAFNFIGAAAAFADEGRVINEELVLKDPTVSADKNWAVGGSIEGWYVFGPYDTYDQAGNLLSQGSINGTMPGGNAFVGYGPLTLQYSHREGKFTVNETYVTAGNPQTTDTEKQMETEITARWLFKISKHFNPYALIGYNDTNVSDNDVCTTANCVWGYKGPGQKNRNVFAYQTNYSSFLFGGGAIIPFNKTFGARADLRIMSTHGKYTRDDGFSTSGSGAGVAGTITGYVNIVQGLNFQAGLKGQGLSAGNSVPSFARFGLFGSLGYSYKF